MQSLITHKLNSKHDVLIHKVQVKIFRFSIFLELLLAITVVAAIIIMFTKIPYYLDTLVHDGDLSIFLKYMFNIVIGIELIKMLCRHDLDSVVEILLFAVARYMILEHLPVIELLIGVIAISILFIIRKYLFISAIDKQNDELDRKDTVTTK